MSVSLSRKGIVGQCGPDSGSVRTSTPPTAGDRRGPASVPLHSRGWNAGAVLIPRPVRAHLVWAVPAVVTALVVGYQAGRPDPWRDEFASWSAATRTVPEIVALGRHIDGVIVPYYLFLHVWIGW